MNTDIIEEYFRLPPTQQQAVQVLGKESRPRSLGEMAFILRVPDRYWGNETLKIMEPLVIAGFVNHLSAKGPYGSFTLTEKGRIAVLSTSTDPTTRNGVESVSPAY